VGFDANGRTGPAAPGTHEALDGSVNGQLAHYAGAERVG
jgi:hypothetical protein